MRHAGPCDTSDSMWVMAAHPGLAGRAAVPCGWLLVLGEERLAHGATSLASAPLSSSEPPDLHFRNTFALYFYHDCSKCYSIPLRVGYIVMFICISSNFGLRPSHCD